MTTYVLDTSVLLAYIENEEGSAEVLELLTMALDDQARLAMSVISSVELFYISWREQGEEVALERLQLINDLPIEQEPVDQEWVRAIGEIKATRRMSLADCSIAALAKQRQATLVHKDPEYEQIEGEVPQQKLPYK